MFFLFMATLLGAIACRAGLPVRCNTFSLRRGRGSGDFENPEEPRDFILTGAVRGRGWVGNFAYSPLACNFLRMHFFVGSPKFPIHGMTV